MKRWTIPFFTTAFLLLGQRSNGQTIEEPVSFRKNSIYFEFAGNGIKESINYDRLIHFKGAKFKNNIRIGLGANYSPSEDSLQWSAKALVSEFNFIFEKKKSRLLDCWELGIGFTYFVDPIKYTQDHLVKEKINCSEIIIRIGWRVQDPKTGIIFRAALTPMYGSDFFTDKKYTFGLWGGLSIGYSFNLRKSNKTNK